MKAYQIEQCRGTWNASKICAEGSYIMVIMWFYPFMLLASALEFFFNLLQSRQTREKMTFCMRSTGELHIIEKRRFGFFTLNRNIWQEKGKHKKKQEKKNRLCKFFVRKTG